MSQSRTASPPRGLRFSRRELAFLIGVPLVWGILLLFHPTGDSDLYYPIVTDQLTAWLTVHLGTMFLLPLMAGVVWLLLRGVPGTAARIGRLALVPFVLLYTAFEVLVGLGSGLIVDQINSMPAGDVATGSQLLQDFNESALILVFSTAGTISWIVASVAAGVALMRQTSAPILVPVLLAVAAPPIAIHVTPFGPAGLALFILAVVLTVYRGRSTARAHAPHPRPSPA